MENLYLFGGGCFAGICGTLVSQPFDTCKIYLQSGKPLNITQRTFTQNIIWFYKGMTPSIIGYSIEKSLVFGTYNKTYNYLSKKNNNEYINTFISGFISGITASITIAPFEQLKINCQLKKKMSFNIKQLYKGLFYTIARESIGFSIYFSVYEFLKKTYISNDNNNIYINLYYGLFGALSAFIAWIPIYPIDINKTRIQSGEKFNKFSQELFSKKGFDKIRFLYKGYHFAMLRAIPFHSTCFVSFEIYKKYMNFL